MTGNMLDFKALLAVAASGNALTRAQAERAFDIMMSGDATPAQMGGLLMAMRVRGETVDEITGAASIMRSKALTIDAPAGAIDTCGTGGDAKGTLNISSGASFVIAACGVPVAKHGNRALSSKTGAADVLAELGVNIDADMSLIRESLWDNNIGFLMAPRHHTAMRNVAGVRVELGTRTLFNLLGPMSNPALVKRQVVGVFSRDWIEPLAHVLSNLGVERAWVVHGEGGFDEMTTTGVTYVAQLDNGNVTMTETVPEDAGLDRADPADLKGGDSRYNAAAMRAMLAGEPSPFRDIVLYTSASALIVAGKAADLRDGVALAGAAVDSGAAQTCLQRMVEITNRK